LLDIEMPGMSGLEVCNALKADPETNEVPVIFITSHHSQDDELAGLAAGAVDFIAKPPFAPLVKARARTQLRLKRLTDMLRQSATQDAVTGTHNRRQLEESLPKLWLRALREKRPISLLMIDIDFFKEYNDTRGHPQGDEVLRNVAQAISENQSSDRDLLARYGGDEFALLLPESSPADTELVAQRIVAALARLAIPHPASTIADAVTVSIGGSTFLPEHTHASSNHPSSLLGPDDLLLAADGALYDAKEAGRGRACFRLMSTPASAPGDATDSDLSEPGDG
jgi:diguanylate cyclase (GGDEF)-like protein